MQRHGYLLALPAAAVLAAAGTACGAGGAQPSARTATPAVSPTASPAATGQPSEQDRTWLADIHQANLAEVEAGGLAAKKGATKAVREAGRKLVKDHTGLDRKVVATARRLGVSLPTTPAPADTNAADRMRNESGKTFDQDFLSTMISGHEGAIAKTKRQVSQGASPEVVSLAKQTLPHLQDHLAMLRKAQSSG
ncbi:DUF4142 domain-containing protein [Actinoallomurus spadix]|uniref:DUF4142 domain-containing protein n=1 Tax=Actinoallomurus spadix TaxID=79912 RepID=A0ABP3HH77_9ACTN|nr:DUF4142 domain-containing protein [Actinoallomurus spadix]MCO5985275.1 DUF4142 domain-containing protein [Actinoallomurus spadix]